MLFFVLFCFLELFIKLEVSEINHNLKKKTAILHCNNMSQYYCFIVFLIQ